MIRSMVKRIFGGSVQPQRTSHLEELKNAGNLAYGRNCKLENLTVSIIDCKPGVLNVEIGDDCYLEGVIVLYSSSAKVKIGNGVFIGPNTTLFCYEGITLENDIMISWGCTLIDTNAHSLSSRERANDVRDWLKGPAHKNWSVVKHSPIVVESKSWIGFNSIITKGVRLGEGTVIACGSVVTKSTENFSVYGGNPAQYIKSTN